MTEKKAYSEAVTTGMYDKATGLLGKYDNVRRFWEDQITASFLRKSLNQMMDLKKQALDRVRILDMGCGSGDAYDLIMGIATKDPGIYDYITSAITPENLQAYLGVDINENLLKQAQTYYGDNPKMRFVRGNLCGALPAEIKNAPPFDLYFSSYGTLSHFRDQENTALIADIARHAESGALFVGDWLGRYSYEWQDLWHHPSDKEYFMDYRISYIYPKEERGKMDIAAFPLRIITRDEILELVQAAARETGIDIRPLQFYDRSILVGRHLDTADYNSQDLNLRYQINSLFEPYVRTDLENIKIDYIPRPGFDHLNNFFEMFYMSCNALIDYTVTLLSSYDFEKGTLRADPEIRPYFPEPLKRAMQTMRRVIEGVGWLKYGDVRANVIEPQLAYCLRELEMLLQPGTGMGHSLTGVFQIVK